MHGGPESVICRTMPGSDNINGIVNALWQRGASPHRIASRLPPSFTITLFRETNSLDKLRFDFSRDTEILPSLAAMRFLSRLQVPQSPTTIDAAESENNAV